MRAATKPLLLFVVAVALTLPAAGQYISPVAQGARSGALGGSLLYDCDAQGAAVDWRRDYGMAALADKTVRLQLHTGTSGTALAAYSHRGDVVYHEQQVALGYGLRLTSWLHAAVAARWLLRGTNDAHYERRQWLAPSALLQAYAGNTTVTLLAGTRPWDEARPWRMHLQAACRPLPQLLTLAEVEREERTRLRLGMEYTIVEGWLLRSGLATRPVVLTFGVGARRQHWSVDLAVEVHDALGITPQTTVALWF